MRRFVLPADATALEAVEAVIAEHPFFGPASELLASLPPDEPAARWLIAAYEAGGAPPWMTAHLLGQIGHPMGYEIVKSILLGGHRALSESYAGPAMARIAGQEAQADLEAILHHEIRRVRVGAAYGLVKLTGTAPALLAAIRRKAIPPEMGSHLYATGLTDADMSALLESDSERVREAAFRAVLEAMGSQDPPAPSLVEATLEAMEARRFKTSPGTRRRAHRAAERLSSEE